MQESNKDSTVDLDKRPIDPPTNEEDGSDDGVVTDTETCKSEDATSPGQIVPHENDGKC